VNASRSVQLARRNLSRNVRGAVLSALGVAVGVGCLAFFTALGGGVSEVVRTRVLPVDESAVEVVPPQLSIGAFFGGGKLDAAALKRLAELPGVSEALPKMHVRVSAVSRYNGDFFGRPLRMGIEVMAVGVDPRLVERDVAAGRSFADPGAGAALPVVISTRLLELYNKSFAAQRNLPTLSADLLTGFRFPAEFGRSYVAAVGGRVEEVPLEVVGFSDRALLGGVTVPIDAAVRLNRAHGQDAETFSSVVLRASRPDAVPELAAAVRRMGFEIDDTDRKLAEQVGWGIAVVTAALALLSVLIALLAAVNIAHAFYAAVRERRREIGVLRAVGASERDVLRVLLTEAAFVGVAGGVAGLAFGVLASVGIDLVAGRWLPDFPFKPDSFFAWSPWILLLGLVVALLAAVGGALAPARSAAKSEPAVALAE
jgi:putative ABC transport system permease protein